EPGRAERAVGQGGVDAGVVGVREVVEHGGGALRGARRRALLLLAARGHGERGGEGGQGGDEGSHGASPSRLRDRSAQGTRRRSARLRVAKSAAASTVRTTRAANARAVSSWLLAWVNIRPRPRVARASSARTAPITATATAILAPDSRPGSAAGASTRRSVRQREAPKVRSSLPRAGSTDSSPSSVVTTIGKNVISATIASLGRMSKPHQKAR